MLALCSTYYALNYAGIFNGGLIQTFHNNIKNEELHTTYNWYQGQAMLFNSSLSMHTFFEKHVGGRLFLFFIMIKTIYMQF